jgi:hypothetical protein
MVRKQDRVIGTLVIWIAVSVILSMILDRLNYARLDLINHWYYSGAAVAGTTAEDATRILEELQQVGGDIFAQTQAMARAELLQYFPYILLICAVVIIGGVLSTLFIWRSVIVPAALHETLTQYHKQDAEQPVSRSLANLLNDDGELAEADDDRQPERNHRPRQS